MIGRRGFQILETLHVSSGSARVRLPFLGENHSPPVSEARRWLRITLPQRERGPPELTRVAGNPGLLQTTRPQTWRWASGGRR
jgi:hypothetical protein